MTKLFEMIETKDKKEIKLMAKSGAISYFTLNQLKRQIKAGVTTNQLDQVARRLILSRGAEPAFLGHEGYEYAICVSINDEVVHGLPSARKIKEGDVVGIDLGAKYQGYYSDTAATFCVGHQSEDVARLLEGTREALVAGLKAVRPGGKIGDIEEATGKILRQYSLSPVLSLCGHGIGRNLHEKPSIKSDGKAGTGDLIKEGMTMAIEPMATLGKGEVYSQKDGWTVKTKDGSLSAHFEHTIVVTATGARLLTAKC